MQREARKFTLKELAGLTQTSLVGDAEHCITGVETLESASSYDASFLANRLYRDAMQKSKAGVICVDPSISLIEGKNFLVSDSPTLTFQKIVQLFFKQEERKSGFAGIHPSAIIHDSVLLGQNVRIGPYAVIDQGVQIGDNTVIDCFASIGPSVKIGRDCLVHTHVVIREHCEVGNRVIIQPGAIIGSCGFGYVTDARGHHTKLEQVGTVIIEDDVEVGANTTIDRARFKATIISRGTKIDNLVQIGHNVHLGQDNIIVSQTGIAGSVKTGKHVVIGGQVGCVGHIEIGDGVMIAARGGISKSMPKPGKYAGSPVMPLEDYNRQKVQLRKIGNYVKKIESLEQRLKELENA